MVIVHKPDKPVSVRHITQTPEDRKRSLKEFRDQKDFEKRANDERVSKILEKRKNKAKQK